jgi:hypothetical protein
MFVMRLTYAVRSSSVAASLGPSSNECTWYRVCSTRSSAGYATPRICRASSSGVIVGRESKQGVKASSKTDDRFVRRSKSEWQVCIGVKNFLRRRHPRALNAKLSSSIKDKSGGTWRWKWLSRWEISAGYGQSANPEFLFPYSSHSH